MTQKPFKSGFVSIVGRPNVGKSTLLNQIVKSKVAITTPKPQTTRHAIRGILNLDDAQLIFVDTPGLHKPQTLMGQHMNATVRRTMNEVDVVVVVLDASKQIGKGDEYVIREAAASGAPVLCVINKADRVLPPVLLEQIEKAKSLGEWVDVLTTSAKNGTGISDAINTLLELLPEGPRFYDENASSDQTIEFRAAELIREKALELTREEVPHSVAVVVEEIEQSDTLCEIYASIYVERDSQKGILIGRGGKMLKEIGTRARKELEGVLGSKVYLDLVVKVEADWQRDERSLERFGY